MSARNVASMLHWSREQVLAHQWARVQTITHHAHAHSRMYRRIWGRAGVGPDDLRHVDDFRRLPLVTKADFADSQNNAPPYGDNLAVHPRDLLRTHVMPGPTANGMLIDPVCANDVEMARDIGELLYRIAGLTRDDIAINTRPFGFSPAGLFMQEALERIGVNAIPLGMDQMRRTIQAIGFLRPTMIEAFTTQCIAIGREARSMGIDPATDWRVRTLVIGGEPGAGAPAVRRELADLYGNPRILEYGGTVETRMVFMECAEHAGLHAAEPFTLIEVLDPDSHEPVAPGEPGLLVLTSLYREAYPVIRFNTGDVVRLRPEPCRCGLSFQRISGYLGRLTGIVRAGGRNQFPEPITAAMKDFPEVRSFQVLVTREHEGDEDAITAQIEAASVLTEQRCEAIREALRTVMTPEPGVRIDVEQVEAGTLPENARFNVLVDRRRGLYAAK